MKIVSQVQQEVRCGDDDEDGDDGYRNNGGIHAAAL